MKVYTYGNILNNSYNLTRFLRAKGVEAEMFLDDSSPSPQDYPWWEDSLLSPESLPEWIHYYQINPSFYFPNRAFKKMIEDFSDCDVALVCHWGPIIARRAGVPFFFYSYGTDLNIAMVGQNLKSAAHNLARFEKPVGLRWTSLMGVLQRRALRKADRIGVMMGYQVYNCVQKLGLLSKMVPVRLVWDIDKYQPQEDIELVEKYKKYEIVYFMVARHTWKSVWRDFKGNDKCIRAFARFVNEKKPNVRLVCIEKGADVGASKKLVTSLGIETYVEWVAEMNKDGIRAYNSLPNVVVLDQFWHDDWQRRWPEDKPNPAFGFGSASIEALSACRPLITIFFDEKFYDGDRPPVLSAFKEDEIYERLVQTLEMGAEERRELGKRGREFVVKYHGWENTTDMYIDVLEGIVRSRRKREV